MIDVAIVGAGPYGLSIAAHFARLGVSFRIFGRSMDSWKNHMPKGMLLKSDGFSCNLCDPDGSFTLKAYCEEQGIDYADAGKPVQLETFIAYGVAFQQRLVPQLEDQLVVNLRRSGNGFSLTLENGEEVLARRVALAVGITHFEYTPPNMSHLPPQLLSHSFRNSDLEPFRGKKVVVIGGGASAIDTAGLLKDIDADVTLVARKQSLQFHSKATADDSPSWWRRLRSPQSGLGTGLQLRFFAEAPMSFHYLPQRIRLDLVKTSLGPSGGWFARDKVVGRIPLLLGHKIRRTHIQDNQVSLGLADYEGREREVIADHIIAATGYHVDLSRLTFIDAAIRSQLKTVDRSPVLNSEFESSVPGLYFTGVAAANSFGPVLRFAYGARFAARTLTRAMKKSIRRQPSINPAVARARDADLIQPANPRVSLGVLRAREEKKKPGSVTTPQAEVQLRSYAAPRDGGTDSTARARDLDS